jgi:hypothetical protein
LSCAAAEGYLGSDLTREPLLPPGNKMIASLTCDVCHDRLDLSEAEVVAAAEVAIFGEAHSEHETCSFTLHVAGRTSALTYRACVGPRRPRG